MGEAILNYFMHNGKIYEVLQFNEIYREINPSIYEVIRLTDGVPLFLEDHFDRLKNSARLLGKELILDVDMIRKNIYDLARMNKVENNNVKILINDLDNINIYLYFIKSEYPTLEMYEKGVKTIIYRAVRKNPHAKVVYKEMREDINKKLKETGCYEALLMNERDEITEGSRSNLFFIRENKLFTAPSKEVLLGITRQKIIKLCRLNGIEVIEMPIIAQTLEYFDAAFISGTSPKVLPISKIEEIKFDVDNKLLKRIMNLYDEEIKKYTGTVHS